MIRLFLELDMIEKTQNKEVKKIQRVYKRFNELLKKREASRKKYFEIGYIVSVDQLPSSLLICIFDFLSIPSVLSIALVSRK